MTTRLKILSGLLLLGVAVVGGLYAFTDLGTYWSPAPGDASAAAPKKPSTRRSTSRPATNWSQIGSRRSASTSGKSLLLELPRQALFITAAHEIQLPLCDRSVDFNGAGESAQFDCTVLFDMGSRTAHASVRAPGAKEIGTLDLSVSMLDQNYPDYAKLAAAVESKCDAQYKLMLAKEGVGAKPVKQDDTLDVPPAVEELLGQIDPQRSFLAARMLHAAIAQSGESPPRLAALVRAYSNLGESTRYFYSRHGSVFFARALLYAERMNRKYPDLPLTHAARGYAYTLLSQPMEGRAAFDKARQFAGGNDKLPAWAVMADDLNHFRTRALFDRVDNAADAPLASYFTLLTVEHSSMASIVINMSRLAIKHNPGSLRIVNIMNDNSGVSLQHETTAQAAMTQFTLLSQLAADESIPQPVRDATSKAMQEQFAPPALLGIFKTMDEQPAEPGHMLPWSAYASLSRDALFVAGFRRLYFADHMLHVDASERLKSWWPILKDHRFAPIIGGFDHSYKLADRQTVSRVQHVDLLEIHNRMSWICDYVKNLPPTPPPIKVTTTTAPAKRPWRDNYDFVPDDTAYDLAHTLWVYRYNELNQVPMMAMIKGEVAKSVTKMCPDHPLALAELIVNRWPETKARAAQIEKEMGSHPDVAYALARSYRADGKFADAARLLNQVIAIAPDRNVYEELAEMYRQQGDLDQWLATYDKYLASSEDFGLDHARKNEQIAYTLTGMNKLEKALPYARAAGDSYSAWGLQVLAACLTKMGNFEEAEQVERANQERYPDSFAWYRWCQATGKGDLAAARKMSEEQARESEKGMEPGYLNEVAVYLALEGQPDRARACWEKAFAAQRDIYDALQLAMLDLEQGKPIADTTDRFEKSGNHSGKPDRETRGKIYYAAAEELQRCLKDSNALPARTGDAVKLILENVDLPYRGCAAYFLGRVCELHGQKDDAKFWYRISLQTSDWNFSCRPQSAAGLRRLGEDPLAAATTAPADALATTSPTSPAK